MNDRSNRESNQHRGPLLRRRSGSRRLVVRCGSRRRRGGRLRQSQALRQNLTRRSPAIRQSVTHATQARQRLLCQRLDRSSDSRYCVYCGWTNQAPNCASGVDELLVDELLDQPSAGLRVGVTGGAVVGSAGGAGAGAGAAPPGKTSVCVAGPGSQRCCASFEFG